MPTRLDRAYLAQIAALRQRVSLFAAARFEVGGIDDAALEQFVVTVVPVVLRGRQQVSLLTDAWLARRLSEKLGGPVKPRGPVATDLLRGVDATEVYARPIKTVRWKLAAALGFMDALNAGSARLADIVATDVQLAKTHTVRAVLSDTRDVTGYRRTLTGSDSCDKCVGAARTIYRTDELMPIHPGCNCGVEEVVDQAPTPRLPDDIAVREHGELGPVLTDRDEQFTGPSDI
jgi:hypothetical protein